MILIFCLIFEKIEFENPLRTYSVMTKLRFVERLITQLITHSSNNPKYVAEDSVIRRAQFDNEDSSSSNIVIAKIKLCLLKIFFVFFFNLIAFKFRVNIVYKHYMRYTSLDES